MTRTLLLLAAPAALLLALGCDGRGGGGPMVDLDAGPPSPGADSGPTPPGADGGSTPSSIQPGAACNCDTECAGDAAHPGLCVQGICMMRSSADCSEAGSQAECPSGSRCWALDGAGSICWPDCDAHTCAGACDGDGSCVPDDSSTCDDSCSELCSGGTTPPPTGDCPPNSHPEGEGCVCDAGFTVNADRTACVGQCETNAECSSGEICENSICRTPPCTADSCDQGTLCDSASGNCVVDLGTPPPGPTATCAAGQGIVPDWRCTSGCADLLPFEPVLGPGYWNYPLNGETDNDQYRSYVRRDVMMLIKYATAMVECQAAHWEFGNHEPLGLGDMSEANGDIPGTREGSPGHPAGTHVNGHDMDIAYYQVGTPDNRLRSVCEHTSGGRDEYHCTGEPTLLDPWRTALFIAHTHINPNLRVIGVDGQVGGPVESATAQLCSGGYVDNSACSQLKLAYETTDGGAGWYRFHHHHLHISVSG